MQASVHQGDIIRIEGLKLPVLVTSKEIFNSTKQVIAVPIYLEGEAGPLHLPVVLCKSKTSGLAHCEKMRLIDLRARNWKPLDRIDMPQIIEVTDAIQSIFDYV